MPHPSGKAIEVDLAFDDRGGVRGVVTSPVAGVFSWRGRDIPIGAGDSPKTVIALPGNLPE